MNIHGQTSGEREREKKSDRERRKIGRTKKPKMRDERIHRQIHTHGMNGSIKCNATTSEEPTVGSVVCIVVVGFFCECVREAIQSSIAICWTLVVFFPSRPFVWS